MSSRPRTQADLATYRTRLAACVQGAIADFIGRFGDELYRWRPTSQANVLRDYIVDNVKREFPDGVDGIRHQERRGLFLLYIRDEYFLRFKKLGRGRLTMNIPTQLSLDFTSQQPLQLFPDLAPALHLNVGYHAMVTLATSTYRANCTFSPSTLANFSAKALSARSDVSGVVASTFSNCEPTCRNRTLPR